MRFERKGCVPRFLSSSELGSVGCILSSSSNETLAQEVSEKQKTKSSSLISDDVRRHSSSGIALKGRRRRLEGGATKPRFHLTLINSPATRLGARVDDSAGIYDREERSDKKIYAAAAMMRPRDRDSRVRAPTRAGQSGRLLHFLATENRTAAKSKIRPLPD